jgi:hypothetical protein
MTRIRKLGGRTLISGVKTPAHGREELFTRLHNRGAMTSAATSSPLAEAGFHIANRRLKDLHLTPTSLGGAQ